MATATRRKRRTKSERSAQAAEALARAVENDSQANYQPIIDGFLARGLKAEDIKPRENVFTYPAWQAKGRQVRRGERGVKIFVRVPIDESKPADNKPATPDAKKAKQTVGRRAVVFHISQTFEIGGDDSGQPLPAAPGGDDNQAPAPRKPNAERIAAQLRRSADVLTSQIEHKLRPMTQRPTARRNWHYIQRQFEGQDMLKTQHAMHALADAWVAGTIPESLKAVRQRYAILRMVSKGVDTSGYYSARRTDEYRDNSETAQTLRRFLAGDADATRRAEEVEAAEQLTSRENELRLCSRPGFFPTPDSVIAEMLRRADIQPGNRILEPSAGMGHILRALIADPLPTIRYAMGSIDIRWCEINAECREFIGTSIDYPRCQSLSEDDVHDFLDIDPCDVGLFDRILMNPPFENGQDAEHAMNAADFLEPGGRLVAIVSEGLFYRRDRKATEFREWLDEVDGYSFKLPDNAFDGPDAVRPTKVATRIVVVEEPAE
ncbi:methyltransferase [Roseimaritima ulvae]|uniref:Methyltransferase small domain protein n=1 Tax=Roseimaritima ulvae TaxID=980254 RepID=A0A5B9QZE8_9BACT|nr:methyltransferase [Roseimaritima ulvae]QEG43452.1 hypothetical protein UC8_55010 [Roseimaritima ulvae]